MNMEVSKMLCFIGDGAGNTCRSVDAFAKNPPIAILENTVTNWPMTGMKIENEN